MKLVPVILVVFVCGLVGGWFARAHETSKQVCYVDSASTGGTGDSLLGGDNSLLPGSQDSAPQVVCK